MPQYPYHDEDEWLVRFAEANIELEYHLPVGSLRRIREADKKRLEGVESTPTQGGEVATIIT